jgi:poly[(R)-3-hydroxyalkanoate] polymerase subunit PhaC
MADIAIRQRPSEASWPPETPTDPDGETRQSEPLSEALTQLDRAVYAALAQAAGGGSPASLSLAWFDWALHLACSPGKYDALATRLLMVWQNLLAGAPMSNGHGGDPRFDDAEWDEWPFKVLRDTFAQFESFWQEATTGVLGVSPHHEQVVSFAAHQWTDMLSPANCWWLNPVVLRAAAETGGRNFLDGARNWLEDQLDLLVKSGPSPRHGHTPSGGVGQDVAITPGKVVYRNRFIELIQYQPQTSTVWREPVLIVPSWILKYYILDLSPHNSLVRYLVEHGHTVFMISWRNPRNEARDDGLNDYLEGGLFEALAQVRRITGGTPVHAAGYCLGGTLLTIGAAAHAREARAGSSVLKTMTLFAAQTDFGEPGELGLFIDASQLAYLDALMWKQGYLDGEQMAAAFQLLRSRDLIWSRLVREYLLGMRTQPTELMAWNADGTRLPYRLHIETLRYLYLDNDLAEGRYCVHGRPVRIAGLQLPIFVVGTERDHVSPWRSVYKLHALTNTEIGFVLTSGGHNAGIISEPGHTGRRYRFGIRRESDPYVGPDTWLAAMPAQAGSWWPCWQRWLAARSSKRIAPPSIGAGTTLEDAPGRYVLEH